MNKTKSKSKKAIIPAILIAFALMASVMAVPAMAQLADTPWPTRLQNNNRTGLSPYVGPSEEPTVKWTFHGPAYSPAIGSDGTIYAMGFDYPSWDAKVFAINPDGTEKWIIDVASYIGSSPAIDSDGIIYVAGKYKLYAIYPDGTEKWNVATSVKEPTSPAIGTDGTIYIATDSGSIYLVEAYNPDGTLKWAKLGNTWCADVAPAIGSDGTIYASGVIYPDQPFIYAINPDGTEKWNFTKSTGHYGFSANAIGSDGTIYGVTNDRYNTETGILYAINPDGTEKWNVPLDEPPSWRSLVLGPDGTIYVATASAGYLTGSLRAFNPDGTLKWNIVGDVIFELSVDAEGTIYAGTMSYYTTPKTGALSAINPDGTVKWRYDLPAAGLGCCDCDWLGEPLTIDADGTIYALVIDYDTWETEIWAFGAPEPPALDLIVTDINAYHNNTGCPAWFNLSNEIDVTVKNIGSANATETFGVSLSIEGVPFGELSVSQLNASESKTVTFKDWVPIGEDCLLPVCEFELLAKYYNFTAVADCDGVVSESNETNNETTVVDKACYNGYMADEPLENVAHGKLHGHMIYTTGDGAYTGLYSVGDTQVTNYDITIPAGATVEVANLNVYYTWTKPQGTCPEMEVSIENGTGTYILPLEKAYNDVKCTCPGAAWILTWGNYVYDLTDYIDGSGTYTVTVENVCTVCNYFCPAAPGIVLVYEDVNAPMMEYWINKGADILMGGRRYPTSSNLAWWECINNATFPASAEPGNVTSATLGVVAPWGDTVKDDILFFNDVELGRGVYHGYSSLYDKTIDSLSMYVGESGNAQVGANVTDVTAQYLNDSDNVVGQCDDGDNIMACNAFLVVAYEEEEPDLNVTEITVNYNAPSLGGRAVGPEPGPGVRTQCNNLSAVIEEDNGVDVESPFDVTFKLDGTTLCTVRVPGLTGASTKTVYCNCSWYPMAGDAFAINVTVDSNDEILESDETNNTMWNTGTVISNGYKGDGWQGPGKNLTNVQCHDQDTNNLTYSVGDSYYVKGNWGETTEYVVNWTTSDLPVPEDADIEKAWLYVYYVWDKDEIMPTGVSLTFNGYIVPFARHYTDRKGFGSYSYPYGMVVYEVTSEFAATAPNKAVLSKPAPDTYIPIRGMLLMVVYKHPDEPERIICIDEGYDMINAQASYGTTPEEATTYAPFECCEPIPLDRIGTATLVAVAPGASKGEDKNRLSFNEGLWQGAWSGFAGSTQLGIAEKDVLDYLKEVNNVASFQDRGDWMEASNAFLILEKKEPEPDLVIQEKWEKWTREPGYYKVYFVVKNIGTATAPKGHSATLSVDGTEVQHKVVKKALKPGETYKSYFKEPVKCTGDLDTIEVCADDFDEVQELNETNNCLENELSCIIKPDLVIEKKWEEWTGKPGYYKVHFVVKNIGAATAPKGHSATLSVDGTAVQHKVVKKALKPGKTYKSYFKEPVKCTGDLDTIEVCADDFDEVQELNETNNCRENELSCIMKPDLVIVEKREKERKGYYKGGYYKVYFVVKNIGTATAPRGHYATLSVDGEEIEHKLIKRALRPGKTYRSSFKTRVECTGDINTIRVCADNYEVIDELDETNNCLENEWTCGGPG